ncbi:AbrB/MazE/SpoVT family DNA-binding domain-containing protein [Bacillus wiedmannii]|uniref:AbrB/MazE/SpoVT family DNA-binding domain-containing protein n=2 Tax=Bacillus cereus group TaxID=86661 RepID=UPI002E1E3350|nr:AbrB/MazE/SpoVT family DNA-binding domain-containing protein [Bacillus wiedmannii]
MTANTRHMETQKIERKVTKIGNSLGLTLPQEFYTTLNIKQGDVVSLEINKENEQIVIKKSKKISMPEDLNPKFLESLNRTINKFDGAFKDLINR